MNTTTRTSTAERLGRAFGRGWRAYARCERRASNWLVSKGMPTAGATAPRAAPPPHASTGRAGCSTLTPLTRTVSAQTA